MSKKFHTKMTPPPPPQSHEKNFRYLIVQPENGGIKDLVGFGIFNSKASGAKFLQGSDELAPHEELSIGGRAGEVTPEPEPEPDNRWVIIVSIIIIKLIKVFGKPMEWTGYFVEFILNLLSLNGGIIGILYNLLHGKLVIPVRGSETFISMIGHLDERIDLDLDDSVLEEEEEERGIEIDIGINRAVLDLCMMASKLAYENANVVRNVVDLHWKMHFVDFYNCWNDYQKEASTQVFIFCDKPKDASLIVISFRGTEPFDADDWITDFDYSWYEIPQLGKVHMGFLEALGLGNRVNASSFQEFLQEKLEFDPSPDERTAYFVVRSKLKRLLKENKNAKFMVTGHSLGGALALLFPVVLVLHKEEEVLEKMLGVNTFGQPRVGNRQLARYMESHLEKPNPKYFRVVYCNDLVPRLPYDNKTFLYKHFGVCLYYNSFFVYQKVREEPNRNYYGLSYLIPEHLNAIWELVRSLTMGYTYGSEYKETWEGIVLRIIGLAIPGLSAHSPTNYINSIRLGTHKY